MDIDQDIFFNLVPSLACIASPDGYFKKVNTAWTKVLGYSQEELLSKPLFDFIHPEDIALTKKEIEKQLNGQSTINFINRYRCKDGSYRLLEWKSTLASGGLLYAIAIDMTESRQREESLKEREYFFRESQRIALIGSYKTDFTTGTWISSQVLDDIFGIDGTFVRTIDGWKDLVHPDDVEMMDSYLKEEVLGKHKSFDKKYRIIRKSDGETIWVQGRGELSYDPEGNVVSMIGTIQDITRNEQMKKSLLKSVKRYKMDEEIAHVGNWEYNLATEKFWGSDESKRIFGFDQESLDFSVDEVENCIPDRERVHQALVDLIQEGKEYKLEFEIHPRNSDESRIIWSIAEVERDENGVPLIVCGVLQDITEQKRTEARLKDKERHLIDSQKVGNLGSWERYIKSGKSVWSEQLFKIFGRDADLGVPDLDDFFRICHPDDREQVRKNIEMSVYEDVPYSSVFRIVREDDGVERWMQSQGQLEKDKNGEPLRMFGIIQDITEKRKLEESVQKSLKLESLGVLAGGIAHDFNNLLSGIFGYIEIALLKSTDEEVSTYLARSLDNIDRTRALTQQLLTFAKGGAPIKEVGDLVHFIQESTILALSGSSVLSRFRIEPDLWSCEFDKNQIAQVVDNLARNGQQAMPDGGTIEVSACNIILSANEHQALAAGKYVKLSIKDHGVGISEENLPQIFDPYFTTKPEGNGLGLSISYSIVNRHGGYIDVESRLGRGSTFHVYLPASDKSITTMPVDYIGTDSCEHRGSGTFLVMDDEEIIRLSLKDILEDFGYTVVLKDNGKDAIDFFVAETKANRKLAGMIFDLIVPGGMGGLEAIGKIRKICTDTPVFVFSGYSVDPVIANPGGYGFNASICKPFTIAEIAGMLNQHMKKLK